MNQVVKTQPRKWMTHYINVKESNMILLPMIKNMSSIAKNAMKV